MDVPLTPQSILAFANVGYFVHDADRIYYWSGVMQKLYAAPGQDIPAPDSISDFIREFVIDECREIVLEAIKQAKRNLHYTYRCKTRTGRIIEHAGFFSDGFFNEVAKEITVRENMNILDGDILRLFCKSEDLFITLNSSLEITGVSNDSHPLLAHNSITLIGQKLSSELNISPEDLLILQASLTGWMQGNFLDKPVYFQVNLNETLRLIQIKGHLLSSNKLAVQAQDVTSRDLELSQRLFDKERAFSSFIRSVPGSVSAFEADPRRTIISTSAQIEQITGYSQEHFLNFFQLSFAKIIHSDDISRVLRAIETACSSKLVQTLEYRIINAAGTTVWVSERITCDEVKGVHIVASVITDITAEKELQSGLNAANSLLDTVIASSSDGILVVSNDAKILRWNQQYADIWGVPEEILNRGDDWELINFMKGKVKSTAELWGQICYEYISPETESYGILQLVDGRIFERHSRPYVVSGRNTGQTIIYRNISERISLLQQQILLGRDSTYNLLDKVPVVACRHNSNFILTYVNQACCSFFGASKEELVGKSFLSFLAKEEREDFAENMNALSKERDLFISKHEVSIPEFSTAICAWINRYVQLRTNSHEFISIGWVISRQADSLLIPSLTYDRLSPQTSTNDQSTAIEFLI